jgi:hypothetical protein
MAYGGSWLSQVTNRLVFPSPLATVSCNTHYPTSDSNLLFVITKQETYYCTKVPNQFGSVYLQMTLTTVEPKVLKKLQGKE